MIASNYQGEKGKEYAIERGQKNLNHLGDQIQGDLFLRHLNQDDTVLDFGCGNGSISKYISKKVKSVDGLEVNPYANELAKSQGLTVYSSLGEIPMDKRFSVVISNHVFEHVVNVIETLQELKKFLLPGGRIILILPLDDWREKNNRTWSSSEPNHHLHTWTPLLIGNTLLEAGLKPCEAKVLVSAWSYKTLFLGKGFLQKICCYMLAVVKKRRQILAIGSNS